MADATVTPLPQFQTMAVYDVDFSTGVEVDIIHSLDSDLLNIQVLNTGSAGAVQPVVSIVDNNTIHITGDLPGGGLARVYISIVPQ